MTDILYVIPARMNSKRFPDKAFTKIHEKSDAPMFECVHAIVEQYINYAGNGLSRVIVATDSRTIEDYCGDSGMECINTGPFEFENGSERVAAIANLVDPTEKKYPFVINVQADQPTLETETINRVVEGIMESSGIDVMTAASWQTEETNPVYVVGTRIPGYYTNKALYFSRSQIPAHGSPTYHIGVYGFKRKFLSEYLKHGVSGLELEEYLEQLRIFDMEGTIAYNMVNQKAFSVNTPEDMVIARRLLSAK